MHVDHESNLTFDDKGVIILMASISDIGGISEVYSILAKVIKMH